MSFAFKSARALFLLESQRGRVGTGGVAGGNIEREQGEESECSEGAKEPNGEKEQEAESQSGGGAVVLGSLALECTLQRAGLMQMHTHTHTHTHTHVLCVRVCIYTMFFMNLHFFRRNEANRHANSKNLLIRHGFLYNEASRYSICF